MEYVGNLFSQVSVFRWIDGMNDILKDLTHRLHLRIMFGIDIKNIKDIKNNDNGYNQFSDWCACNHGKRNVKIIFNGQGFELKVGVK